MPKSSGTLAHFCRVLMNWEGPYSQVTEDELAELMRRSHEAPCIVEIGCFEGKTAAAFARNTAGLVFSIDPFLKGRLGIAYGRWIARLHFRRLKVVNVRLVDGWSFDVAPGFSRSIDFLFIDGDHSYEGIRRDWSDWFSKVRVGGLVALHDCRKARNSPAELGTMRFYGEDLAAMDGIEEVASVDSLVILRRTR